MTFSLMRARGFTLVEVVVVLAVIGVSLAVIGPSLIVRRAQPGISEALTASRRAAIRRGESMELAFLANGGWTTSPVRSRGEPLLSGTLPAAVAIEADILVSPLGVCTVQRGRIAAQLSFDPLGCTVADSAGGIR